MQFCFNSNFILTHVLSLVFIMNWQSVFSAVHFMHACYFTPGSLRGYRGRGTRWWRQILDRKWKYGRLAHAQWKICNITLIYGRISKIVASFKKSGARNTMVTSDFSPEVEIRLVRACAKHPAIIIGTVRSLWTWLCCRYHVPQNTFLVYIKSNSNLWSSSCSSLCCSRSFSSSSSLCRSSLSSRFWASLSSRTLATCCLLFIANCVCTASCTSCSATEDRFRSFVFDSPCIHGHNGHVTFYKLMSLRNYPYRSHVSNDQT